MKNNLTINNLIKYKIPCYVKRILQDGRTINQYADKIVEIKDKFLTIAPNRFTGELLTFNTDSIQEISPNFDYSIKKFMSLNYIIKNKIKVVIFIKNFTPRETYIVKKTNTGILVRDKLHVYFNSIYNSDFIHRKKIIRIEIYDFDKVDNLPKKAIKE